MVITIIFPPSKVAAATLQKVSDVVSTASPSAAAVHTIAFTTVNQIPASGKIVIRFSGTANNSATPSATTFAFNGLTSSSIQTSGVTCSSFTISAPSITCITSSTVPANTKITIIIGCLAQTNGVCTSPSPVLLNPSKSKKAGTSDVWTARIRTQNSSGTDIDVSKAKVATLEGVEVRARIESTLTFSITGINDNVPVNTGNSGCGITETTNSGFASTPTSVNLGRLANTPSFTDTKIGNISAQLLSISTNAPNGYSLTASASGHLINQARSFSLADSTTPLPFPLGKNWFGIHPCGADVAISTWVSGTTHTCSTVTEESSGNICKYAFPGDAGTLTLASDSSGPVGADVSTGNGVVTIEYAAGIDSTVPADTYSTVVVYTITPTF